MLNTLSMVAIGAVILAGHVYAYFAKETPSAKIFLYMIGGALVAMAIASAAGASRSAYAGYFYATPAVSILVSLVFIAISLIHSGHWIWGSIPLVLLALFIYNFFFNFKN